MRNSSVVSHLVSVRASVGHSQYVGARLGSLIDASTQSSGCLHCAVQRSMTDENVWSLSGTWSDASAMNDWFCAPELAVFSELLAQRLVTHLDFQTFEVMTMTRPGTAERMQGRHAFPRSA